METLEAVHRLRETKVASAFLYIKKKPSLSFGGKQSAAVSSSSRVDHWRLATGGGAMRDSILGGDLRKTLRNWGGVGGCMIGTE